MVKQYKQVEHATASTMHQAHLPFTLALRLRHQGASSSCKSSVIASWCLLLEPQALLCQTNIDSCIEAKMIPRAPATAVKSLASWAWYWDLALLRPTDQQQVSSWCFRSQFKELSLDILTSSNNELPHNKAGATTWNCLPEMIFYLADHINGKDPLYFSGKNKDICTYWSIDVNHGHPPLDNNKDHAGN